MKSDLSRPFVPPRPIIPTNDLRWHRYLAAVRTNALLIWPQDAYEQEIAIRSFLGRKSFLLNQPDVIRHVLVDNAANYRRTAAAIRILRPIVGAGLLLSEGDNWRHQRRTIAPALAPRVIPTLSPHMAAATQSAIARLGAARQPVDLLAAMQFLALEIAARTMFSLEMDRYYVPLRELIVRFANRFARLYFLDLMLPAAIPTLHDLARMRFRSRWRALMDEIIKTRMQSAPSEEPRDLFDLLLAARDPETRASFSRAQLRDQTATMIVAGHETTALALFWSLYLLASLPAEQERVAEEVRAIALGPEAASDALSRLSYTRAVVSEALRLYPPAFAISRNAVATDQVGQLRIPRGSVVVVAPWVLHRHVRLWEDPNVFNPSRFLGTELPAHRFAYLPFGAGPRVCVGAQFAMAEATLVLAMLIQNFEVALADHVPVLAVGVVTTQPDHSPPFLLKARR